MAKERHGSLETSLILIELLRWIPKPPRYISARDLVDRLDDIGIERELRSVQRHLEALSAYFPIERDERTKPYGYRWLPDVPGLSFPQLTPQESVLLTFAYDQLRVLLPNNLRHHLNNHLAYARKVLSLHPGSELDQQWLKKVRVISENQPLLPPEIDDVVLDTVSNALYENRYLDIVYHNAQGQTKKRTRVMPLGLAQQGPRIYLVAQFDGYDNQRILALHRIHAAAQSDEKFDYPADFDLEQYDDEGHFGITDGQWVRLSFCMDKTVGFHLTETPLEESQTFEERADHYVFSLCIRDSKLLDRWLCGWGERVWAIRKEPIAGSSCAPNTEHNGS